MISEAYKGHFWVFHLNVISISTQFDYESLFQHI